jgi:hypothetical protein
MRAFFWSLIPLIPLKSILLLSTLVFLGYGSGLFPSGFPTNNLRSFLFPAIRTSCDSIWFDHSKNHEAPRYVIFSNLPSLFTSLVQIFSSAPFSQTPSVYASPLISETTFHTHTVPQPNYSLVYSKFYVFLTEDEKTSLCTECYQELPEFNLLLISSRNKFYFNLSFQNILIMTHFQTTCLPFLCPDFDLHSGDEIATYTYIYFPCNLVQ